MDSHRIADCNFRSSVERDHAYYLEFERQMGRVDSWKYELEYPLSVNGQTVCHILPDFTVYYPNGKAEVHEIKGGKIFKTPVWALKKKLFQALYPWIEYRVFDKFKKKQRKVSLKTYDRQAKRWVKYQPKVIQVD